MFFTTAKLTQMYAEVCNAAGIPVLEIHSRKSQSHRYTLQVIAAISAYAAIVYFVALKPLDSVCCGQLAMIPNVVKKSSHHQLDKALFPSKEEAAV